MPLKPKDLTNGQIVKRYEELQKRSSKLNDQIIEAGFGHLKTSETRSRASENPLFAKYVQVLDEMWELRMEAEFRYGPGLASVSHLKLVKARRKKP